VDYTPIHTLIHPVRLLIDSRNAEAVLCKAYLNVLYLETDVLWSSITQKEVGGQEMK
jgi:hypothetical protein